MHLYLHVHGHTCGGAHGVYVVSMEDVETYVLFSLSPFPTLRQGLSLTETGRLAVKAMGIQ